MKKLVTPLLLITSVVVLATTCWQQCDFTNNAVAQVPKGRQGWEYATLYMGDASVPQIVWGTGKVTVASSEPNISRDQAPGINELYRKLGGKKETATTGMLLDHIGQDGWELVSYTRSSGSQNWIFKRPAH